MAFDFEPPRCLKDLKKRAKTLRKSHLMRLSVAQEALARYCGFKDFREAREKMPEDLKPEKDANPYGRESAGPGMTRARYNELCKDLRLALTEAEVAAGWYFDEEYDGLLVHESWPGHERGRT